MSPCFLNVYEVRELWNDACSLQGRSAITRRCVRGAGARYPTAFWCASTSLHGTRSVCNAPCVNNRSPPAATSGRGNLLQKRLPTVRAWIIWKIILVSPARSVHCFCLTCFYSTVIKQRMGQIFRFYATNTHNISVRKVKLNGGVDGMILLNLSSSYNSVGLQLWRQAPVVLSKNCYLYLLGIYASYSHNDFSSCIVLF